MAEEQPNNSRKPADHLKEHRFKPGQSGNPGGRPKGSRSPSALIRHYFDEGLEGVDLGDALIKSMFKRAIDGSFRHCKEIVDRLDGKTPDVIHGDGELKIIVEYADDARSTGDNAEAPPDAEGTD